MKQMLKRENMRNKDKGFYKEYFNCAFVLYGKVKFLEKIKQYIIKEHVNKYVKLIKPTYAKSDFSIVSESEYWEYMDFKNERIQKKHLSDSDTFYFAFLLRGEVEYIEKIREYITQHDSVEIVTFTYDKERLFIVDKSQFEYFKKVTEQQ